jgi:hypothetical protein
LKRDSPGRWAVVRPVLDGLGRQRDAQKLRRLIETGALDKAADSLQEMILP